MLDLAPALNHYTILLFMSSYEGKKQGSMRKELSEEVLLELRPQVGVGINSAKWVVEAVAVVEEIIIPAEGQNVQTP